ncbi:hypothetical protein Tco_0394168 [Tanacetum coccineum]
MLDVSKPSTSPSRITSSPSHSPEPSPSPEPQIKHSPAPSFEHSPDHTTASPTQPSLTQPSPTQPSTRAEHHFPTPHDSPLHVVHSHGSDKGSLKLNKLMNLVTKLSERIEVLEDDLRKTKKTYSSAFTKLILRVQKLEARVKIGKARKRAKVVLSEDDEDVVDDSSKQGRKLSDAEVQEKSSTETKPFVQEVTPIEVLLVKFQWLVCLRKILVLLEELLLYRRRSEEKRTRKDKGKAIMTESEPKKKSKEEIEQERLSFAEAIRLRTNEEDADTQKEMKEVVKESGAKRKKSLPRKRRTVKRQKLEEDAEKEELWI